MKTYRIEVTTQHDNWTEQELRQWVVALNANPMTPIHVNRAGLETLLKGDGASVQGARDIKGVTTIKAILVES